MVIVKWTDKWRSIFHFRKMGKGKNLFSAGSRDSKTCPPLPYCDFSLGEVGDHAASYNKVDILSTVASWHSCRSCTA